jgi:hypothetical protein
MLASVRKRALTGPQLQSLYQKRTHLDPGFSKLTKLSVVLRITELASYQSRQSRSVKFREWQV